MGTNLKGINLKQSLIEEYFGIWAIDDQRFNQMCDVVRSMDLVAHVQSNSDRIQPVAAMGDGRPYAIVGDVAYIDVRGVVMKYQTSFGEGASTLYIRKQLKAAALDSDVSSVVLMLDSPGGTVSGVQDLVSSIKAFEKPIGGYVEDLCASACYWIGSQCDYLVANQPTALVGSIGTYAVVHDFSQYAEQNGIKVHVIRAGEFKGMGEPGTPITEEALKERQRIVESLNQEFLEGVASGRGVDLNTVQQWADGRVHPARAAQEIGLIDAIGSVDLLVEKMSQTNGEQMSEKTPATIQQIKANCSKADDTWILSQVEGQFSIEEVSANYGLFMEERDAKKDAAHAAELEKVKAEAKNQFGSDEDAGANEPLEKSGKTIAASDEDGPDSFVDQVNQFMEGGMDRHKAIEKVSRKDPKAYQAYLLASQNTNKAKKLLADKFAE